MKDYLKTLFIDKEKLDIFEYDIAKALFLDFYQKEFSFDESKYYENLEDQRLIVRDRNFNRKIIYLFNQPNSNEKVNKEEVIVFYKINKRSTYETRTLDKNFVIRYEYILNHYITDNEVVFNLRYYNLFIRRYESLPKISNDHAFKYYNSGAVKDLNRNIDGGYISFSNPLKFNDPFDCDLEVDECKLKDKFRVLCTTDRHDNILMWSYYGEDHKGFCYSYRKSEILSSLSEKYNGICFYGYVKYEPKRPKYKHIKRELEDLSNIKHLLNCLFTKYENWRHEEEFRFIIVHDMKEYYNIQTKIHDIFEGCIGNSFRYDAKKLFKDKEKYSL